MLVFTSSKPMRLATLGAALLSLTLAVAPARADAVAPPPTNCPDGTTGMSCHGGVYCQPTTCKTSADCTGGQVCEAQSVCLGQVTCGGGVEVPDGGAVTAPEVNVGDVCTTAADCDGGATCGTQSVCVTPSSSTGCSCEAAGGGGGPLALSMLALVAGGAGAVARWRRKGQRASAQRRA